MQIEIYGQASQKIVKTIEVNNTPSIDLLTFLRNHGLPMASSCSGKGVCQLCLVNEKILSCSITIKDFIKLHGKRITISYL